MGCVFRQFLIDVSTATVYGLCTILFPAEPRKREGRREGVREEGGGGGGGGGEERERLVHVS